MLSIDLLILLISGSLAPRLKPNHFPTKNIAMTKRVHKTLLFNAKSKRDQHIM